MDRRVIWAIGLMMVIAIAPTFFLKPPAKPVVTAADSAARPLGDSTARDTGRVLGRDSAFGPVGVVEPDGSIRPTADTITVSSPLYRYAFSTRGGAMVQATLARYNALDPIGKGKPVELLPAPIHQLALNVGNDTVSLAGFSERLFTLTPQTDDRGAQRRALDQLQAGGETALYDSLIRAAGLVRTQPSPRAIVAFTDGGDVVSRAAVQTVRSALQAADVVLYLIVGADAPAAGSPLAQLARIASETGGDAWFAPRMDTLGRHFTDIARDLSGGYLLSYLPDRSTGDGTWRELRVELVDAGRGHRVRARQGYIATGRYPRADTAACARTQLSPWG